ncbi:anti-sigma factor family protein [Streptomyces sp. NPDC058766]|uniref:anti-sigma factor family protein n=1 Tax=Streptomyces sp. NPDC058766 TaxID=3346630 RepID=UPI003675A89B
MTPTTDMAGHPDVAEISDLAEGLLPPARSRDLRRHLDDCELCDDVYASLEEIRGLLGTLPGTPRMPDDVAHRIDAALAAEALLNAAQPEVTEDRTTVAALSASEDDSGTHVSRETSAPADRPAGRPRSSTTGPGRKTRTRNGRRRIAVLGAVLTAAALGFGSVLLSSLGEGEHPQDTASSGRPSPGDTFSEGKLHQQVTVLLAESKSGGGEGSRTPVGAETAPSPNQPKVFREPVAPACVRDGIGRDDAALAVENGRYQGKKAMLVLLPDTSDDSRVTAYVVDATCVDHEAPASAGKVLLERTYPSA